mmetsp:Transcript_16270/g.19577  ORF Transcript_16270/g.19577 Transcript_16270/m.19577 type:complete len:96 (-) Transcript_16270:23-310(-)
MECQQCSMQTFRSLTAPRKMDGGKQPGLLHEATMKRLAVEVDRCQCSFEEFILRARRKKFPEPVGRSKVSKPRDDVDHRGCKCHIQECEVLVVHL